MVYKVGPYYVGGDDVPLIWSHDPLDQSQLMIACSRNDFRHNIDSMSASHRYLHNVGYVTKSPEALATLERDMGPAKTSPRDKRKALLDKRRSKRLWGSYYPGP